MIGIKNEDALTFLKQVKSNTVDLILTDPPYEISKESGYTNTTNETYRKKYGKHSIDFGQWDYDFKNLNEIIKEFHRILKDTGTVIIFYDIWKITTLKQYLDDNKFNQLRFLEWIKTNPVPINSKINYLSNSREIAISAVKKSKPTFNSQYDNGIYSYPICRDTGRFHPTQKPLLLFQELIRKHSNENDLVLDCFSGSGTTAVACEIENRNFIGCEIEQNFYKKSLERLK